MRKPIFKLFALIFFTLLTNFTGAQITNFGSDALLKPEPCYKLRPYIYADFVKTFGIGIQRQFGPYFSIDIAAFRTYQNKTLNDVQENYNYYQGYGFSLLPGWNFAPMGNLVFGFYFSLEWIKHDSASIRTAHKYSKSTIYNEVYSSKGIAATTDVYFGVKMPLGSRIVMEPFAMVGIMSFIKSENTYYSSTIDLGYSYPYTSNDERQYYDIRLGVKFSFGCKKDKTHIAVDKKFDEDYIPWYNGLNDYMSRINPKESSNPRLVNKTKRHLEDVNRRMQIIFRRNYNHPDSMYEKMNTYLNLLEDMVQQVMALPPKQSKN